MWKRVVEVFIKSKCLLVTTVERKVMVDGEKKNASNHFNTEWSLKKKAYKTQIVLVKKKTVLYL